jgi:hypothetical protein
MSDFGAYQYPKARKAHRCSWCGETISAGEEYTRYAGMWENEFQSWAMHNECFEDTDNEEVVDGFMPYEHKRPKKLWSCNYCPFQGTGCDVTNHLLREHEPIKATA